MTLEPPAWLQVGDAEPFRPHALADKAGKYAWEIADKVEASLRAGNRPGDE